MRKSVYMCILLLALPLAQLMPLSYAAPSSAVVVVDLRCNIDEGARLLVSRGVAVAEASHAKYLILVVDTYGGYLYSMDRIIEELSKCPCRKIAWIPPGGKAVSAGAIIVLSADEVYVGSGSVLGACQPRPPDEKVVSYVKARVRSLAEAKGLSEESSIKLEKMVTENRAFTADELLKLGLASGRADSLPQLLEKLGVANARVVQIEPDLVTEIYSVLFDPGLAVLMLIVGVLLVILEVKATGFQGWGLAGAFMIAIALYSLHVIGWHLLTLTLVVIGLTALILELKKPGIQILGVTGISLLVLAVALEYFKQPFINPWRHAVPVGAATAVISALIFFIILKASEALRLRRPSLEERLRGKVGYAKTRIAPGKPGVAYVDGEDWTAISNTEIEEGSKVRVVEIRGLTLVVEKAD